MVIRGRKRNKESKGSEVQREGLSEEVTFEQRFDHRKA